MTAEWPEIKLGEVLELAYGKGLPKTERRMGKYPVYGSNGIVGFHDEAAVSGPGIIVGRKGSCGEVHYCDSDFWPIDTTYYVQLKTSADLRFIAYMLSSLGLNEMNSHSTIPGLNRDRVYQLKTPIPPLPEQKKIAAVLLKIQRAIEAQDKIIQSLRDLKKSTMQQLFTHGLRGEKTKMTEIGEIPESWEVVPLKQVCEFLQYGTSKRCTPTPKGVAVLRIPNVIGGKINTDELKYADVPVTERERFELASGDVLFVRTNGQKNFVGRTAVYRDTPVPAMFASYLIRARLIQQKLRSDYLQLYTEIEQGKSQLAGRATPASDGKFNINTKTINSIVVPLPGIKEQDEIVVAISGISSKADIQETNKIALQDLFTTTLNKLMTGDIRVGDLNIDVEE